MNWKILHQRQGFNLIGVIILVIGLSSAVLIYKNAGNDSSGAWGYGMVDGHIYPIRPGDTKMYRHNLELYGGKANVIMDDFRRWFAGLWQGKSLACIIGCTSIIISLGFFYAAKHLPERLKSDVCSENAGD